MRGRVHRTPLATPLIALCVVVTAACASSNAAPLDTAKQSVAPDTTPKALVLVVNPSARARSLAFDHAGQIVRGGATFNLMLLGIYEQPVGVRKALFNRPFIADQMLPVGTSPSPPAKPDCNRFDTEYQRKK